MNKQYLMILYKVRKIQYVFPLVIQLFMCNQVEKTTAAETIKFYGNQMIGC